MDREDRASTLSPYQALAARGAWTVLAEVLVRDGIAWFWEYDLFRIQTHVGLLAEAPAGHPLPDRVRLMQLIATAPTEVDELGGLATRLLADGDLEGSLCAHCSQLYAIWTSGRGFDRQLQLIGAIQALLRRDGLPPKAVAAALSLLAMAALLGPGDMGTCEQLARQSLAAAEQSGSVSLRVYAYTCLGYALLFDGRLSALEVLLFDALALRRDERCTPIAGAQFDIMHALSHIHRGRPASAEALLAAQLDGPGGGLLPVHRLLAACHRTTAAACGGDVERVEALSACVQQEVMVHQRHFFQGNVHLAMSLASLVRGKPSRALAHAERAITAGARSPSPHIRRTAPLLQARALAALGRAEEAEALYAKWIPTWTQARYRLYAASAAMELAHLALARDDLAAARRHLATAAALASLGEPACVAFRPAGFGAQLALRLDPPTPWAWTGQPVRVHALGGLRIEPGGPSQRGHGTTLALLGAVLSYGGEPAPAERVADLVWPDADGDRARHSLKVGLSRLRRAGTDDAIPWIRTHHGHVVIDSERCAVDCFAAADLLDHALAHSDDDAARRVALAAYTGPFLGPADEVCWAQPYRQALEAKYRAVRDLMDDTADAN